MLKIAVSGAAGKMAQRIINLAQEDPAVQLVALLEQKGHPKIGSRVAGITISDDPEKIEKSDCLIEFTAPSATGEHLEFVLRYRKAVVIGTTGLDDQAVRRIEEAAKVIPVVFAPNMSIGVNLLFKLVKEAAAKLSANYRVNIIEAHHVHKKDAPSGTAKKIAEIIKDASGRAPQDVKSIREGEIIGDHRIIFESELDRLELFHSAKTRDIFAAGAITAAKWVKDKQPGLYSMQDVLFG